MKVFLRFPGLTVWADRDSVGSPLVLEIGLYSLFPPGPHLDSQQDLDSTFL